MMLKRTMLRSPHVFQRALSQSGAGAKMTRIGGGSTARALSIGLSLTHTSQTPPQCLHASPLLQLNSSSPCLLLQPSLASRPFACVPDSHAQASDTHTLDAQNPSPSSSAAADAVSQADAEAAVRTLLQFVGEDPERQGLLRTPHRVAKAMTFLTQGYTQDITRTINGAMFDVETSDNAPGAPEDLVGVEMESTKDADHHGETVIVRDIEFYSLCEHHMLPFLGKVHVAYIPSSEHGRVIGLSKLARITDMFSRRLQVQERLSREVRIMCVCV
jgi:GTP cyclohydrolase I